MIFVAGGAGFIGANFVLDWLAHTDEPVVNVDKLTYAGHLESLASLEGDPRHVFVHGDIGEQALIADLLERYRPRAIVNLAAESHVDRSISDAQAFVETNVVGTYRLIEAALTYWKSLPAAQQDGFRLLHVSTDEVFGSLHARSPAFTEDSPYRPNSPYAASKAAADHFVRAWHHTHSLPVITTNCSNNYGPYQHPEKLIPLMIDRALRGEPLPVYGDGSNVRDWLFVLDHCAALRRVLAHGRVGATYNIGGSAERTNLAVVRTICGLLDQRRPRERGSYDELIAFVADRPGHDLRYAVATDRIQQELGWRPEQTFDSGLARTVDWYLTHGEWVEQVSRPPPRVA